MISKRSANSEAKACCTSGLSDIQKPFSVINYFETDTEMDGERTVEDAFP
jgi:hypothetical protein